MRSSEGTRGRVLAAVRDLATRGTASRTVGWEAIVRSPTLTDIAWGAIDAALDDLVDSGVLVEVSLGEYCLA